MFISTVKEVVSVDIKVQTVEQILKNDGFDNSSLEIVYLSQSLNNLGLLPVEIVRHQTARCQTFLRADARHCGLSVEGWRVHPRDRGVVRDYRSRV